MRTTRDPLYRVNIIPCPVINPKIGAQIHSQFDIAQSLETYIKNQNSFLTHLLQQVIKMPPILSHTLLTAFDESLV